MPVGVRDLLLVIRAKDQASRVIRDVGLAFDGLSGAQEASAKKSIAAGSALLGVGVAMTAVGVMGVVALKKMTDAAIEYNNSAALTLTQTDNLGASVQDIADIGLRVAAGVAAPLDQLQPALYDIFSSMNVNLPQAEALLTQFAKAAVAGQVDVQTAGRATIAIMNAYKIPVENASEVMDFQFQLVRKGVGTYEEFASSLGRVLPSARRAGQDLNNLGGVLAFLTRNGLSTSLAATSAARAFDNLANSKVRDNMAKLGVQVVDAQGNFRQMSDVASDLGKVLDGLSDADKAAKLDAIFKGAGNNIQARRFWDLAIRNYQDLNSLTDDMIAKSGSLEDAYKIMFDQPAAQSQLLKNNLDALKISLGQALIPMFMEAVKWITRAVQWFNGLSASTKSLIARIALFASAGLIVVGVLAAIIGVVKILSGALELAGGLFHAIGLLFAINPVVLVVLAAIAAIAYVIYRNWDTLVKWWNQYYPTIKEKFLETWNAIKDWWYENWPKIEAVAKRVLNWLADWWNQHWPAMRAKFMETWNAISTWWYENWPQIRQTFIDVWNTIVDVWNKAFEIFQTTWAWLSTNIPIYAQMIWDKLQQFWAWLQTTFGPGLADIWNAIKEDVVPTIQAIIDVLQAWYEHLAAFMAWFVANVWPVMQPILQAIMDAWPIVVATITGAWDAIVLVISGALDIIRGLWEIFAGLFTADWSRMWEGIKEVANGIWEIIKGLWQGLWTTIQTTFDSSMAALSIAWNAFWPALQLVAQAAWDAIKLIVSTAWDIIQQMFDGAIATIEDIWSAFWNTLKNAASSVIDSIVGLVQGLIGAIQSAIDKIGELASKAQGALTGGLIGSFAGPLGGAVGAIVGALNGPTGMGVEAGQIISRNEFGRELFVPSTRGTLFNANTTQKLLQGNAASRTTEVHISEGAFQVNITGDNVGANRRMVRQELERFVEAMGRA